jgi:hypothetical protein
MVLDINVLQAYVMQVAAMIDAHQDQMNSIGEKELEGFRIKWIADLTRSIYVREMEPNGWHCDVWSNCVHACEENFVSAGWALSESDLTSRIGHL